MRCDRCRFWVEYSRYESDAVQNTGVCSGMNKEDRVEIQTYGCFSCSGGVEAIITDADFFCKEFKPKISQDGD